MKYTKDHEWLKAEGALFRIGISGHAVQKLGDVVFVELPEPGRTFRAGEVMAVVESVKAASDVFSPCDCEIKAINETLADAPETVNRSPEEEGWFVLVSAAADCTDGLMDSAAYAAHCRDQE